MNDPVNNPGHYNQNGIEVIDVIETYAKSDFRLANVIKYVCRCEYKGKKLEDLKKAQWYLSRVIAELEDEEVHAHFDSHYTHYTLELSPERIAADDEAASRIKAQYYDYDASEALYQCANPACRMTITTGDPVLIKDEQGRAFCSMVCDHLVNKR